MKTLSIIKQHIDPGAEVIDDNAWVLCPSPDHHDRRRTNCSMSLSKQIWNCFACGESGTLKKALTFFNATGVSLPEINQSIHSTAQFRDFIIDPSILSAYGYYADPWIEKGFSEKVLDEHSIGYDIHNRRITIPLFDEDGGLIGISGRATLPHQEPRYLIYKRELGKAVPHGYSPKTRNHLWRFNQCKHIEGPILVVEGFKAALWATMAGYNKTVALCGSHMTRTQVQILIDHNRPIVLMLDKDEAGIKGTQSSVDRLSKSGLRTDIRIVDYAFPAPDDIPLDYFHTVVEPYGLPRSDK